MTRRSAGFFLVGGFIGVAVAAIVAGFLIIGSPATQRHLAFDKLRMNHLLQIALHIDNYWAHNDTLPDSLEPLLGAAADRIRDPETGAAYTYRVVGSRDFQLCAAFSLAAKSGETLQTNPLSQAGARLGPHGAGLHCFDLKAAPFRP